MAGNRGIGMRDHDIADDQSERVEREVHRIGGHAAAGDSVPGHRALVQYENTGVARQHKRGIRRRIRRQSEQRRTEHRHVEALRIAASEYRQGERLERIEEDEID